jgi:phospho-N-acetylmuramoyl-pentapeptide-transferase
MRETALAIALSGLGFMLAVIWGTPLIRLLKRFRLGKMIRVEGPESHITKMGTPTMGGLMVIIPVAIVTILMNAVSLLGINVLGRSILLPLFVMVAFGILGGIDDWEGIRGPRRGLGMRARTKFFIQVILAIVIAYILKNVLYVPQVVWPGTRTVLELGIWYIPIATFIIVAMSNAVNLTDGLDGLAGLISVTAFAAYGGIALMQGNLFVGRFCFTIVGALFGFLWFNVHPAMLFMGDLGSLSLGAVLGVVSLMTGQWLLLPLVAIIPISNNASSVLQVAYFKLTKGKRLFKMAPLHHHFELLGWSETQVVQRFWLISLLFGMFGVALALS